MQTKPESDSEDQRNTKMSHKIPLTNMNLYRNSKVWTMKGYVYEPKHTSSTVKQDGARGMVWVAQLLVERNNAMQ